MAGHGRARNADVAEANRGMTLSEVPVFFQNAGVYHLDYDDISGADGYDAMLKSLRDPTDATLGAPVHALREQ